MKEFIIFLFFQGVVVADINLEIGMKTQEELKKTFVPNKCLFVKTDVTDLSQFESMFVDSKLYLIKKYCFRCFQENH